METIRKVTTHLKDLVAQAAYVEVVTDVLDQFEDELLFIKRSELVPIATER